MKYKDIMSYVVIILAVVLIRTFVFTVIRVNQESMYNTLKEGDLMILKKYDKNYDRFDIVVVNDNGKKIIKRIIGLPKETIEYKDSILYINEEVMEDAYSKSETKDFKGYCAEDEYFVMGDNRLVSKDSRIIGCIEKKDIVGKASFRFFPFSAFGIVD